MLLFWKYENHFSNVWKILSRYNRANYGHNFLIRLKLKFRHPLNIRISFFILNILLYVAIIFHGTFYPDSRLCVNTLNTAS